METYKKFKIEQNALRIYIFTVGIGMTIYCGLLCFGIRNLIAELLCITGAYILLCGGAWMFRLCWLSWAFIAYSFAIRLCIMFYSEGLFDGTFMGYEIVHIAHCTAFIVGLALTGCFIFNIKKYYRIICGINV